MCILCTSHVSKKKYGPLESFTCVECGTNNHPNPGRCAGRPFVTCRKCGHIIRFKAWDGFLCSPGLKIKYGL